MGVEGSVDGFSMVFEEEEGLGGMVIDAFGGRQAPITRHCPAKESSSR